MIGILLFTYNYLCIHSQWEDKIHDITTEGQLRPLEVSRWAKVKFLFTWMIRQQAPAFLIDQSAAWVAHWVEYIMGQHISLPNEESNKMIRNTQTTHSCSLQIAPLTRYPGFVSWTACSSLASQTRGKKETVTRSPWDSSWLLSLQRLSLLKEMRF